jgi:hypothetical protein
MRDKLMIEFPILMLNNNPQIGKDDEHIILARSIFSAFSLVCCLFLMIVYIILCLQVKFNICIKNGNNNSNDKIENDYTSDIGTNKGKDNNNKNNKKIGLGSNFMFLLTVSNFFGSLFEFLFYFYYKKKIEENKDEVEPIKIYKSINEDSVCHFFGFFHNFWDLSAVCWTTMLTLLFYRSTNLSNEMLYEDKKYLAIGFIYCLVSCLIFCIIPYIIGNYGFAIYYCSFRYMEFNDSDELQPEKIYSKAFRWSFVIFTGLNNIFNAYCLIRTYQYYSKKLAIIKKQNKKEYKLMLIYVWVFRIFPIVLLISRIFKGISRIIIEKLDVKKSPTITNIIQYINAFLFASNGIFDSIACIFFFKGVFWCCSSNSLSKTSSEEKGSDLDYLGSEVTE